MNGPIKEMELVVNLSINKTKCTRPKTFYMRGTDLSRNRALKSYATLPKNRNENSPTLTIM